MRLRARLKRCCRKGSKPTWSRVQLHPGPVESPTTTFSGNSDRELRTPATAAGVRFALQTERHGHVGGHNKYNLDERIVGLIARTDPPAIALYGRRSPQG